MPSPFGCTLDVHPGDGHFTFSFNDGNFGGTGMPMIYDVIGRSIEWKVQQTSLGPNARYSDDHFGADTLIHATHDSELTKNTIVQLLGDGKWDPSVSP